MAKRSRKNRKEKTIQSQQRTQDPVETTPQPFLSSASQDLSSNVSIAHGETQAILPSAVITPINPHINSEKKVGHFKKAIGIYRRITWFTLSLLGLLILASIYGITLKTVRPLLINFLASLILALAISLASCFFNQSRFHYKIILTNETVSRFLSVFASFYLSQIIRLSDNTEALTFKRINIYLIFLLSSFICFGFSIASTNKLKGYISDKKRHNCIQKEVIYYQEPVSVEEGYGQKVCANTSDNNWLGFRRELDEITNNNLQICLLFSLFATSLQILFHHRNYIRQIFGF